MRADCHRPHPPIRGDAKDLTTLRPDLSATAIAHQPCASYPHPHRRATEADRSGPPAGGVDQERLRHYTLIPWIHGIQNYPNDPLSSKSSPKQSKRSQTVEDWN